MRVSIPKDHITAQHVLLTTKQSTQHILGPFVSGKQILLQNIASALGVQFLLEKGQIIGIMLFLSEIFLELDFVTQRQNDFLVSWPRGSLVPYIALISGFELFGGSPEGIDAKDLVGNMIFAK